MGETFKTSRKGNRVVIELDLDGAMAGTLKSGRPGASLQARGEHNGKPYRLNLNVFQAGKAAVVTSL